jgi:hypothetical protein
LAISLKKGEMRMQRLNMAIVRLLLLIALVPSLRSAEIVQLNEQTWEQYAPGGKEVDAIYGDYVMRNDRIVAVIANPVAERHANMTVRDVGGCLIDMTRRDAQSDQLSAYYFGAGKYQFRSASITRDQRGRPQLLCTSMPDRRGLVCQVAYTIADGWDWLEVEVKLINGVMETVRIAELIDFIRADRTFLSGRHDGGALVWLHDKWFGQAYGVLTDGSDLSVDIDNGDRRKRTYKVTYAVASGDSLVLSQGDVFTSKVRILCAPHVLGLLAAANAASGKSQFPVRFQVVEPDRGVNDADVKIMQESRLYGTGRTGKDGLIQFALEKGWYAVTIAALGRMPYEFKLEVSGSITRKIELPTPGTVTAFISNESGDAIPCKVQFMPADGSEPPNFFDISGEHLVENCYYSHNGQFTQPLAAGKYDVIISHGPEFDAVFTSIDVAFGKDTLLKARLRRSVDTRGWISSDFHSHSTLSGDNTASQLGRVLNLLCEHIEFAPCTEHNRLSSYVPHLQQLGVEHLMATCVGMELTGSPGELNHQNAFPLVMKPRIQDNGAPARIAGNPVAQIERLALWDNNSDKVVQVNHPNIQRLAADRNLDGEIDGGFAAMLPFVDVIEVHPLGTILDKADLDEHGVNTGRNRINSWLMMLNQGWRVPGVVNTDAHNNFHGSGWLRNYIKSPGDDPAQIRTSDIVRETEAGHLIMSNGPFLEVLATSATDSAIAGDDLYAPDGQISLKVRVQCPNWLDIDRVQIMENGRASASANFTRSNNPERFSDGVVKFDQTISLRLESDTHLIVVAIGEHSGLGPVMGPSHRDDKPAAVCNPIWLDIDGNGFQANGDLLMQ